jgi:hypothetical protein
VATGLAAAALVIVALGVVVSNHLGEVLDRAPTTTVVAAAIGPSNGFFRLWAIMTAGMMMASIMTDLVGRRTCDWALRQPGDVGVRITSAVVRRRQLPRSPRSVVLAIDRRSVWRCAPLRRGLVVLSLLPGAVAALAGLDWSSLVLLPGLVSAGSGLLFGVNAFCLDGSGSLWLETLPRKPALPFWSKAQVVAETCFVAIALTLGAAMVRATDAPSRAQVAALVSCAVVALVRVVALCMELSLAHPYRADLRGPRDTPAPPGVMAAYSARLALSTTLVAIVFSALAEIAPWQWPIYLAVPLLLLGARRLLRAADQWDEAEVRTRVVTVVASG